jgi:glycosyltransferase involved in cell wall biosynthesis
LGIGAEECLVLWQGIVRPYKGLSFLLKAWKSLCAATPSGRLAIVGTGEDQQIHAIREEVRALDIQHRVVLELRFISVAELADYYDVADVVVYPYSEITTSGALMTGVARGKTIVATLLPAFQELLRHGENALLVRYGDVDALSGALRLLLQDAPLRRRLGERLAASAIPQWIDIAARTADCYETLLPERNQSTPPRIPVRARP